MNRTGKAVSWSVWISVALVAALLALALFLAKLQFTRVVPPAILPVISHVPAFTLTNQLGQPVTLENLKGRVWVADIIFTSCAGPCPVMTGKMRELQDALPTGSSARLITLTTDPETDTPAVLRRYAEKFGANPERWNFLTGGKKMIANVAMDGLKLSAVPTKPEERTDAADLFVHTTIFVIVDKQGQLRGSFQTQGELVDWAASKAQILATVKQLESEP